MMYILLGESDVFSKSSRIKISFFDQFTNGMVSQSAIVALITGNMMRSRNTIPYFVLFYPVTDLNNFTADFVSQNMANFSSSIPLGHITATNSNRFIFYRSEERRVGEE